MIIKKNNIQFLFYTFLFLINIFPFTNSSFIYASDLITQEIIIPGDTEFVDEPFKPKFVICNINVFDALANEWHVVVKIINENEVEVFNEIVPGVFLAKGSSSNPTCVTLQTSQNFTPITIGNYTISVDVNYNQDINTANDELIEQFSVVEPPSFSISGNILEDINYGGNLGSYTGAPRPNVIVELYNSDGSYISSTITGNNGSYSFSEVTSGDYIVRVVNYSVSSSRPGNGGSEGNPIPIQTFRTDATSGTPVDVTNKVGGENPSKIDADVNSGGQNLLSLTNSSTTPQSITNVKVTDSNVWGINFVFNFSTIVNTNSDGQGCLRQFIINSNILSNTGLAQAGQAAGIETSIFMIPSSNDPLSRPADPNYNGSTFNIYPSSELPPVTDKVKFDGFIQTALSGNTNSDKPEIILDGSNAGETSTGISFLVNDCKLTGMIIQNFGGNGIYCSSKIYLGTSNQTEESVVCLSNGFHGIQSKSVDYVGDNVLVLEKNGKDGIRIENDLDVDGIRSMENGGWGVHFGDVFNIRRDIAQRSYFWENGLGGIYGINGLLSGSYIDCYSNGNSASINNPNEGHGVIVKNAYLRGASSTKNKKDGINAETINHTEVDGLEKLTALNNGGNGIKLKGTMTADGITVQDNEEWGILSESGNVYILKDSKNLRNYIWNNAKGGISVTSGTFKGKFLDFSGNGKGASSDNDGYGLIAKNVIVNGIEVSDSKNDGIKAESIKHTRILGQEDLLSVRNGGDGINVSGNITADGLRVNNNKGWGVISEKGSIDIKLSKSRNYASYNKLGGISAANGTVKCNWLFTSNNGELAQNSNEGCGIIAGRVIVQEIGNGGNKGDGIRAQIVNVSNGFSITDNDGYGIVGSKVRVRGVKIARNKKGGIKILRSVKRSNILAKINPSDNKLYSIDIENSTISDNLGYGIDVDYFEDSNIINNNILRNNGLNFFSYDKTILANGNWWGENSSPTNSINEFVKVDNWLSGSIDIAVLTEKDLYFSPAGNIDSILYSVVNIIDLTDSLKINISDSLGWFEDINYSIGINDSSNVNGIIEYSVPNISEEQNRITIKASSINKGKEVIKVLNVTSYSPIYSEIKIIEDSLTIIPGDTVFFQAIRVDQNDNEFLFNPTWSSTSGLFINSGMFISDSTVGLIEVIAQDQESGLSKRSFIYATNEKIVLTEIKISPSELNINPGDVFEFFGLGVNQFGFPMYFTPVWNATGGTIDLNGLFIAGENEGQYQVSVSDSSGLLTSVAEIKILVGIDTYSESLPEKFILLQNYPNPFNPTTKIKYSLPARSQKIPVVSENFSSTTNVTLKVYDVLGREITTLVNKQQKPGNYEIQFDASNLNSGIYFYKLSSGNYVQTKRMILIK